ncbi:MAG: agmatinase [Lentisphaerae bacterium]|jgi:agmatinase|nr:agmatinase [Lentisphaerota bacterium]
MSFIGADSDFASADAVIFGAPYDSTTSFRPGARFGSAAIRSESFGIETFSPYQDRDLEDIRVHDAGDLELPFGAPEPALAMIEEKADEIVKAGKMPVLLGGEHLVTLGAVRAVARKHPDLHIIHFDAHADLREDYLGNPLSHACVLRRCYDLLGDGRIFQFGIRSGTRDEFAFMADGHVKTERHACATLPSLSLPKGTPVYLTIDMDVIDPSEFPGTGTQEAGGLRFRELLSAVIDIFARFSVVAFDLVELAPALDPSGRSTALACKLLRECLLAARA